MEVVALAAAAEEEGRRKRGKRMKEWNRWIVKESVVNKEEEEEEEDEGSFSIFPSFPSSSCCSALGLQNPLEVLGFDLMMKILGSLDARSVALSLLVSHGWNSIASADHLWGSKCEELLLGKAHLPRLLHTQGLSKLAVYSLSVTDGKRDRIGRADLCDHAWEFHFTKAAPEYWRNLDPYWQGKKPLMHRYFHPDGSQTADPDDQVWGGHECCYTVVTSLLGNGQIREHYVRINRWLQLDVHRKQDWGWEMSNDIFSYSSIADGYREGGTGRPV
ncbi:unnamed protein product [Linum tenue]|uniref:F-box domain-containing protein n=1 Tax=Linum tenue TaxID=586396 RepID=A0AAV0HG94_9ROSI|nr:unnamed protein product [Linum tenue]